jgi:hypothetical protein
MRKLDPFTRREEILTLLHQTPLATTLIAVSLDLDPMEVKNDLAFFKYHGLIHEAGKMPAPRSDGASRLSIKWGADMLFTAEELEQMAYGRKHEELKVPDLPPSLLALMGYTLHEPGKGRKVYASKIKPAPTTLKRHRVWPGTSWGGAELRMPG